MPHQFFSQRTGSNPNAAGLPLSDIAELFTRIYDKLRGNGYFHEAFGFSCVDAGYIDGKIEDIDLEILLTIRKRELWPIATHAQGYSEDDLFDLIEFLFQHVSKPIDGTLHSWGGCGMHWETFSQRAGQDEYREEMNRMLSHYKRKFELTPTGEVLAQPVEGFEAILKADVPSTDANITRRVNAAVVNFRRHGSSIDDRRQAVRDLVDVLEYLRPKVKTFLTTKDEGDLFNIANNFGIRHLNDKQKTSYDAAIWLSWMFYFYLATIHVVLRKIAHDNSKAT